jgi:hypothetical protein
MEGIRRNLVFRMTYKFVLFVLSTVLWVANGVFMGLRAQESPIAVADQTFRVDGTHTYTYALAEGDQAILQVQLIAGKGLRSVEFVQLPNEVLFRAYQLDSSIVQNIAIPRTGAYALRITEAGLGKKVARFVLHRQPAGPATRRLDTRIGWDIAQRPDWQVQQRAIQTGKATAVVRSNGQVTVPAAKLGMSKSRTAYFFNLPPNTTQWAYRVSVGQSAANARRADAQKFADLTKSGATKIMAVQPETALAAFALGLAVDMTVSTAGEDVEYILADAPNTQRFLEGQTTYNAFIWQGAINIDVQRRYDPLAGTYAFAFKNNNWMDDINVEVDIEAVTDTPVWEQETFLVPR